MSPLPTKTYCYLICHRCMAHGVAETPKGIKLCERCHRPVTKETIERAYQQAEEIKTANAAIIARNIKVRDAIVIFMESIGFKKEESYYKSIYAKKRTTNVNGWWGEVNLKIPTSDSGYENFKSYLRGLEHELEKQEKDRLAAAERQKAELAFQEKEKEARAHLIKTCIKYDLSAVNLEELRDALMVRCKYLELAWHLQQNSYNSYNGFTLAEEAYNKFIKHPDFSNHTGDVRIAEAIAAKLTYNDLDNIEVFAVKPYSYLDLYEMVDPTLKADFDKTIEYMRATH